MGVLFMLKPEFSPALAGADLRAALQRAHDLGYSRGRAEQRHRNRWPWRLAALVTVCAVPTVLGLGLVAELLK